MKEIFVTGATGFVGKHLCKKLRNENYRITAFIRSESAASDALKSLGVNLLLDSKGLNKTREAVCSKNFSGIVHLATCYKARHAFAEIDDLVDSNIAFSTKLLDIALQADVPWFLNTGTLWQNLDNKAYSPANLYAATKQAFETIAQYYRETGNIKFVTLKLNDSYGPDDTRPKIFNLWEKISRTGETLDMSKGEQLIDTVHVNDIADAFSKIIALLINSPDELTEKHYSTCSGNPLTLRHLSEVYQAVTGKELNINWGARPYRQREIMKPCDNIPPAPGWRPKISLEDGIKSLYGKQPGAGAPAKKTESDN